MPNNNSIENIKNISNISKVNDMNKKDNNCKDYWKIKIINIGRKVLSCLVAMTLILTASMPVQAYAENKLSNISKADSSTNMVDADIKRFILVQVWVYVTNRICIWLLNWMPIPKRLYLAEETGGRIVRESALNYATLEYDISLLPRKEEIRQKIIGSAGVLNAEWSNTSQLADSVETVFSNTALIQSQEIADPQYSLQWAIQNIRADKVWEEGVTGNGIIVAVIDTGVDLNHSDLKGQLVQGYMP
jgi:subtilisin family serine protease